MKRICCALIALLPSAVFAAYPIEVEKQLNGAEVSYTTQDIDHDLGAITLSNLGQSTARCTAVFRNGPETPRTRKAVLKPGQTLNLTAKFTRSIIKLRIQLTCGLE
ncbi:3-phosphoglycerate kinase [Pseudomonas indica]|uniref:3-phosphoglycerate kinase n=1 Tax=Pseudomonas indica TaxID=137658 RepID=UPI000BAC0250|nr:3-phosphoglycerate kinase [Pseudomonas indica]MBU3057018.1 3-phosphoglycerate kinase [Pseudomonas indica]PAU64173.1 3-phosphoglycerate kinase [Pseudomonas indica]